MFPVRVPICASTPLGLNGAATAFAGGGAAAGALPANPMPIPTTETRDRTNVVCRARAMIEASSPGEGAGVGSVDARPSEKDLQRIGDARRGSIARQERDTWIVTFPTSRVVDSIKA